jgi:hypothetical protein
VGINETTPNLFIPVAHNTVSGGILTPSSESPGMAQRQMSTENSYLIKKFPTFYGTKRFIMVFTRANRCPHILNSIEMNFADMMCGDENWIGLVQNCAHWQGLFFSSLE